MEKKKILIIDRPENLVNLKTLLEGKANLVLVTSRTMAFQAMSEGDVDIVVIAASLGGIKPDTATLAEGIRQLPFSGKMIVVSGNDSFFEPNIQAGADYGCHRHKLVENLEKDGL